MKKILVSMFLLVFGLCLVGCEQSHEHTWGEWQYNDEYHWRNYNCEHSTTNNYSKHIDDNNDNECDVCLYKIHVNTETENENEITDANIINGLLNITLDYQLQVPDNQLSYSFLWDGYDESNKFGPNIPEIYRLYTYLTEYKAWNGKFYLIYLKENVINSYLDWLNNYEQNNSFNERNYHFSSYDNKRIIDGKYFYCFQMLNKTIDENIKFYEVNSIENIKFKKGEYQLILCAQSKKAIIKENLSTMTKIDREIILFNKYELIFDDNYSNPEYYLFDNVEKVNQNMIKNMFDYKGEMIEAFPSTYESLEYGCFPALGLGEYASYVNIRAKVIDEVGKKYILLPRSIIKNGEYLDLLSYESDLFFEEDVYKNYKEIFLSAIVKQTDIVQDGYLMALYDYSAVLDVIKP